MERLQPKKIANDAVVTIKLADGSVTSAKILDGTVTAVDIANGSIMTAKIANGAVTTEKIADGAVTTSKIADGNVTNVKLADGAIPYNSSYGTGIISTTETDWVNMSDMSIDITLERTSHLLIMVSTSAYLSTSGDYILIRALVGTNVTYPDEGTLTALTTFPTVGSFTFIFYLPSVTQGTYTVYVQWRVWSGTAIGLIDERTLNVIGLPA